jgi:pSer/pThr/pTyr-binding forkhead associated (FHA) protein
MEPPDETKAADRVPAVTPPLAVAGARLIGRTGKAHGIDQAVGEMLSIGSSAENGLRLGIASVSGRHAQIVKEGDAFFVQDLGSSNGTFLNGQRVKGFSIRNLDVLSLGPEIDLIFVERATIVPPPQRGAPLRATILWLDGPFAGKVEEVTSDRRLVLGRGSQADLAAIISRSHAVLSVRGGRLTIEDLGSANGTFVNGAPIAAVTPLAEGDEVSLARLMRFRVSLGEASPAGAPSSGHAPEPPTLRLPHRATTQAPTLDMLRPIGPSAPTPRPVTIPPDVPAVVGPAEARPAEPPAAAPAVVRPATNEPAEQPPAAGTVVADREPAAAPRFRGSHADAPGGATVFDRRDDQGGVPAGVFAQAAAARDEIAGTVVPDTGDVVKAPRPEPQLPSEREQPSDSGPITGVRLEGTVNTVLNLGSWILGRDPQADVVVDSLDVSRRHARLHVRVDAAAIEDLDSANGTFVDGEQLTGKELRVRNGGRIRLASLECTLTYIRSED